MARITESTPTQTLVLDIERRWGGKVKTTPVEGGWVADMDGDTGEGRTEQQAVWRLREALVQESLNELKDDMRWDDNRDRWGWG